MEFSREALNDEAARGYMESRNIEDIKNRLRLVIRRRMSQHLNLIKEEAKGFSQSHTEIHRWLTRDMHETVEQSELIIRQIVDDILPGALDLVSQIGQLADQWSSQVAPEAVMACDDDEFRPLNMGLELGPSNHRHGESSMGPPPRPTALPTPVTPGAPKDNVEEDAREPPPPIEEDRESVVSDTSLVSFSRLQTARRSLDVAEMDHPGSPELPARRAKSSTTRPLRGLVTNSVDFQEVEGNQFIFQDKRYSDDSWLALWCDRDKQQRPFLGHPFRTKAVFNHFDGSDHPCHGSDRRPELEEILREHTYRGEDPSEVTIQ